MTILTEAIKRKPHWLYLINSGNNDDVFKVGYTSRDIESRLEEIKIDYTVPMATIQKRCRIYGEAAVLSLEKQLHKQCYEYWDSTYGGVEWFELDQQNLTQITQLYDSYNQLH